MSINLSSFQELWSRWEAAKSERTRQVLDKRRAKVDRWEKTLVALDLARDELISQGRWISGPSSLMAVLGRAHREVYHCRVVAWLMRSTGKHGLAERFLHGFLLHCFPDEDFIVEDLRRAKVGVEEWRPGLRTDIYVTTPQLTLVVEAKTVSGEGPSQCDATYLRFKEERNPHFVFLTRDGTKPSSATGSASDAFRPIAWRDVARIAAEALKQAGTGEADQTARGSVRNYLSTLREEFN